MSALTATVEATTTHEIKLAPSLKRKLLTELRAYAAVKAQMAVLDHAAQKHKMAIGKLRDETGEQSLSIEGFRVTLVAPVRTILDQKRLIAQGVTIAQIEAATITKPGRAYEKITLPGAREESDE